MGSVRQIQVACFSSSVEGLAKGSVRLVVQVTKSERVTNAVFVKFKSGGAPERFLRVASPIDLQKISESEPDAATGLFRGDKIDVFCDSQEEAQQLWYLIKVEIQKLVDELNAGDKLALQEVYDAK